MRCKSIVNVIGVRRGKGQFDDGRQWSNCKVLTIEPLLADDPNIKGFKVQENKCTSYEMYEQFSTVPGKYDVEIEMGEKSNTILSAKFVGDFPIKL